MPTLCIISYLKTANITQLTSRLIMHKYQIGDKVSFINMFKLLQEGIIQDQVTTGDHNAYTIEGYDLLVLEKNIVERLARALKKTAKIR